MRYCGRAFTSAELQGIRQLIEDHPTATRAKLSRLVCEQLGWRRDDGRLKDMSCRVAMLRMHDDGRLELPPPRNGNNNGKPYLRRTLLAEPGPPIQVASPRELGELQLQLVTERHDSHLHNEYIDRYHYLGYQPLPGDQLRYFVRAAGRVVALLGFGAAAWKTQPRDRFIGWTPQQRQQRLHLVTNNARSSSSPGSVATTSPRASWAWRHEISPTTGNGNTATSLSCWRPSSNGHDSEEPATRPPTGPSSARPRAGANSMSETRPACPRRPSGSTPSTKASEASSADDPTRAARPPSHPADCQENAGRNACRIFCPGLLRRCLVKPELPDIPTVPLI